MRVKYIIPFNQHLDCINLKMYELICHELKTRDNVDVVDSNPDIVHVFGMWNAHNASCVEKYRSIGVPVVFTLPRLLMQRAILPKTCPHAML